jgi:hypothetical protein
MPRRLTEQKFISLHSPGGVENRLTGNGDTLRCSVPGFVGHEEEIGGRPRKLSGSVNLPLCRLKTSL